MPNTLRQGRSLVNLLHIFRTTFPKKSSGWLLLNVFLGNQCRNTWICKETSLHSVIQNLFKTMLRQKSGPIRKSLNKTINSQKGDIWKPKYIIFEKFLSGLLIWECRVEQNFFLCFSVYFYASVCPFLNRSSPLSVNVPVLSACKYIWLSVSVIC